MKKNIIVLGIIIFSAGMCLEVSAGLINYDRRQKRLGDEGTQTGAMVEMRDWMRREPRVTNRVEERYDINRDGKLQTAEVKIFLRDVIDEVQDKGRYSALNSDVLKEYDKNKDKMINKYELTEIIKDVR